MLALKNPEDRCDPDQRMHFSKMHFSKMHFRKCIFREHFCAASISNFADVCSTLQKLLLNVCEFSGLFFRNFHMVPERFQRVQ